MDISSPYVLGFFGCLLIYVIILNCPEVKAYLARSKVGKVFRVCRRVFWTVIFLACFWWFNLEHFIAIVEFNNLEKRDRPIEEIYTRRDYKDSGIVVYARYKGNSQSSVVYYMPSKLDFLINR